MDIQTLVAELRQEIGKIESAIEALLGLGQTKPRRGRPPKSAQATAVSATAKRGPRKMSAAARAKIAAAQRARWAKQKGQAAPKTATAAKKKPTGRKPMSPAMKKKLSAMMKARWAARKKQ
jgi:hypothetical protein